MHGISRALPSYVYVLHAVCTERTRNWLNSTYPFYRACRGVEETSKRRIYSIPGLESKKEGEKKEI